MRRYTPIILTVLLASGCSSDQQKPTTSQTRPEPPQVSPEPTMPSGAQLPAIDAAQYTGPAATVKVLQLESFPVQCVASIEVTTPTGGWTLAIDQAKVIDGTAKIFMTLEKPAKDEMVTPALVTHREQFKSVDPCFTHAEVYIHVAQRGIHTLTTNYRLAAKE
jgi:hypothetical protein